MLNWVSEQSNADVDVDCWCSFLSIQMAFPLACIHSFIHSSIHSSQFPELILCYFSKHCRFKRIQRRVHSMHGYAWIRKFIQLNIMCQMNIKILKWHISLCTTTYLGAADAAQTFWSCFHFMSIALIQCTIYHLFYQWYQWKQQPSRWNVCFFL